MSLLAGLSQQGDSIAAHNADAAAHGAVTAITANADWKRALCRAASGGGLASILWLADSWTAMPTKYWLGRFTKMVKTRFGGKNPGYISFNAIGGQPGSDSVTPTVTLGSGWTPSDYPSGRGIDNTQITATSATNATLSVQLAVDTDATTPTLLLDSIGATGSFRYRFNGAAWSTVTITEIGFLAQSLSGAPAGNWLLEIELVDAGSGFRFFGLNAVSSNESHPVIHNAAGSGWGTDNYSTMPGGYFKRSLAALNPDLTCIFLGNNDRNICLSLADVDIITANLQTIITRIRETFAWKPILVVMPPENYQGLTKPVPMSYMSAEFKRVADSNGCLFLDLQPYFGTQLTDYGDGARELILSSNPGHPTTDGCNAIASAIFERLFASM